MNVSLSFRIGALALLVLSAVGLALVASSVPVPPTPRLGRRGARRRSALMAGGLFAFAEPLVRWVAGLVALAPVGRLREHQERELRRTDYVLGLTPDEYGALALLSALGLGLVAGALAFAAGSPPTLAVPAAVLGLFLPKLQVQEIIRRRVKEVSRGLPNAIEVAAMCMGAGLDFPGAIRLLAEPQGEGKADDALARELQAILEALDVGRTRREALLEFAERVPTPAVRDFVAAVVQAEQKGNPLAKVLQVQGRMLNMRRSVAAEEAAARAGVLMIVPMVFLLGCILLLLMGPFLVKGIGF